MQEDLPSKHEKKSIQWSSIFGLDRKKKSTGLVFHPLEEIDERKKKSASDVTTPNPEDYGEQLVLLSRNFDLMCSFSTR